MGYKNGIDRNQITIMPESLDDFVSEDNICRIIDAFVNMLKVKEINFKYAETKATGCPPYSPLMMTKLYLYGYMNRIRSSRRLEAETKRNVEVMWLTERQMPDDKTISNFRKDNKKALKLVFKKFNEICKRLDLFGKELVAIDGTKIKANNARHNNYTQADVQKSLSRLDKKIEEYLRELDENDLKEAEDELPDANKIAEALKKLNSKKAELEEILKKIDDNDGNAVCTVDEDAKLMKLSGGKGYDVCFNVQTAVDDKHGLIVDFDVTDSANDINELSSMCEKSKEMLDTAELAILADKGYSNGKEIKKCEDANALCYVPKIEPSHQPSNPEYNREKFMFISEKNLYICPAGNELHNVRTRNRGEFAVYSNRNACINCAFRSECTKSKTLREIERSPYQEYIDKADERAKQNPEIFRRRQELSEHPFGITKRIWGFDQFLCKGKVKASGETSLMFLAFNLRRAFNILGFEKLKAALC